MITYLHAHILECLCLHSCIVLCACVVQWEKQMVRSANFITIQGLTPNKTYYIRVLAFTSVGDGPLSQDLQIIAKTGGKRCEAREGCEDLLLGMYWTDPPCLTVSTYHLQEKKKQDILTF